MPKKKKETKQVRDLRNQLSLAEMRAASAEKKLARLGWADQLLQQLTDEMRDRVADEVEDAVSDLRIG